MIAPTWTHASLVERALAYAKGSLKCDPAWAEHSPMMPGEQPDVFGLTANGSVVIECKANRADFLRDKAKSFRKHPEAGMGSRRWYMAPQGVITPDDFPRHADPRWGLLIVTGKRRVQVARKAQFFEAVGFRESVFLRSAWNRRRGCTCGEATTDTKERASA